MCVGSGRMRSASIAGCGARAPIAASTRAASSATAVAPIVAAVPFKVCANRSAAGQSSAASAAPTPAKAAIDGLVDAGLLPDDDGKHVGGITLAAPRRPPAEMREGLLVLIVGRTR